MVWPFHPCYYGLDQLSEVLLELIKCLEENHYQLTKAHIAILGIPAIPIGIVIPVRTFR